MVAYESVKTKENSSWVIPKVVAVAYESLRASLCKILISSFAHKMDFAHNLSVDFF